MAYRITARSTLVCVDVFTRKRSMQHIPVNTCSCSSCTPKQTEGFGARRFVELSELVLKADLQCHSRRPSPAQALTLASAAISQLLLHTAAPDNAIQR